MKSRELSRQLISPFPERHGGPKEKKSFEEKRIEDERDTREAVARMIREQIKKEENISMAVREVIAEIEERNLMWRNLRFDRLKKDGNDYVEIVDRLTGDVLKVLPQPDYNQLANHFKKHPGLTLDINA
ncbi:MAG: flagellar protein FlaG [bacterium]|nr:flagellar protein FlaG [bacterium]